MSKGKPDEAITVRAGEELDYTALQQYLCEHLDSGIQLLDIRQFPSGYSNLTYLLELSDRQLVLRRPPVGAEIKTAHDMSREFNVLEKLAPLYPKIPKVLLYCDNDDILGAPFYIMERLHGIVLRQDLPQELQKELRAMWKLSTSCIDNLVQIHQLDTSGELSELGKPEGYSERQINGWIKRYRACQNREVRGMELATEWMTDHIPGDQTAFIHNDYKYDNLMLSEESWEILAVLDWEMATLGHPLMDLGTTLGYWAEASDHPALKPFSLTWHPGNLNRQEVVDRYFKISDLDKEDMLPFYVFGCFKIGVIVQQIYARYIQGITKDQRFAGLGHVVAACAQNIENAITHQRINHFY